MWEMQIQPLDWEDPLEEEMATHSSFLTWEVSGTEVPGWLQAARSQEPDTTERLNNNLLNYLCLICKHKLPMKKQSIWG